MENILAPSILSADFKILGEQIEQTEKAGAKYIHFDVMDGIFVPSISFGMPVLSALKGAVKQALDVHLMVTEPIRYVKEFAKCGADIITVHLEACEDVKGTGADMTLIMSVEPGFGGQAFIPESLDKIKELRTLLDERGLKADIEVDGGIYCENVEAVLDAGANIIVAGTAVFKGDIQENVRGFLDIMEK